MKDLFCVNCKPRWSNRNDEYYYTIEIIDSETGKLYHTYVSEDNRNWDNWASVISVLMTQTNSAPQITGLFRAKRNKPDQINADSQFKHQGDYDLTEVMNWIYERHYA